jgi:hypothetical protein
MSPLLDVYILIDLDGVLRSAKWKATQSRVEVVKTRQLNECAGCRQLRIHLNLLVISE